MESEKKLDLYNQKLKSFILSPSFNKAVSDGSASEITNLLAESNSISDFAPLSSFTGLKTLCLDGNKMETLASLPALPNLEELYLGWNLISQVDELPNLLKLKILWIYDNKISDEATFLQHLATKCPLLVDLRTQGNPCNPRGGEKALYEEYRARFFKVLHNLETLDFKDY